MRVSHKIKFDVFFVCCYIEFENKTTNTKFCFYRDLKPLWWAVLIFYYIVVLFIFGLCINL